MVEKMKVIESCKRIDNARTRNGIASINLVRSLTSFTILHENTKIRMIELRYNLIALMTCSCFPFWKKKKM